MPLFHRREPRDATASRSAPPASTSGDGDAERDWRAYDRVAGEYARSMEAVTEPAARKAVELLGAPTRARVLDVGTGTGVAARAAATALGNGSVVVGADPSRAMIAQATERAGGPRYVVATSIDLPFRDAAFDALLLCFAIAHFTDYRTALSELVRVVRPAGRVAVATWAASEDLDDFKRAWRDVAEEFAEREILADAQARAVPWEERFADPERLKKALHDAGVRDIWIERMDYCVDATREEYLTGRETSAAGRFLQDMLGEELWPRFRTRVRDVFAERSPERFSDFHQVLVAVGHRT